MKKLTVLTAMAAAVFLLTGCDDKEELSKITKEAPKEVVYNLADPRGEKLQVKESGTIDFGHDKEYTLVVFWATWCAPCRAEIPHLINIQNEYEQNLKVVASLVEQNKPNSELSAFMKDYKMNYFVSNGADEYAFSKMVATKLGLADIKTIPTAALFKNGEYVSHWIGPVPEEMITAKIEKPEQGQ